jgi:hypothetical protein
MKQLLLLLSVVFTQQLLAQKGSIRGKLVDSVGKQELANATINLLNATDSTMEAFSLSKADGSFALTNLPVGEYILNISFQSYVEYFKRVRLSPADLTADLGNIYMQVLSKDIGNVTVYTAPVQIKGDTVQFNAGSFKTKPNATTEDLLKKLPGVEVSKDGSVKQQGETVQKVLVDGKQFFGGGDPKLATQNLPAEMIDKVQFFDDQSEQSKFSGFDDGNRQKTMNITTKKDRKKGTFGSVSAGGGTEGRYKGKLNLNIFNGNRQFSVVGGINNVNEQNFSFSDILGLLGGGGGGSFGGFGGGGRGGLSIVGGGGGGRGGLVSSLLGGQSNGGIATNINLGVNYKDVWSRRVETNGSYFFNSTNTVTEQTSLRQTFLSADTALFTNNKSLTEAKNQNHRVNWQLDWQLDSLGNNTIQIRPSFTSQKSDNNSATLSDATKNKVQPLNNSNRNTIGENNGMNFNNDLLFRHRFAKRGRSFSVNLSTALNNNNSENTSLSYNEIFFGGSGFKDTINQFIKQQTKGYTLGANASFTEPINKEQGIELNYNYNYNNNQSDRNTFDFNKATQQFDRVVTNLSNEFDNNIITNRVGATFQTRKQSYNWAVGLGYQAIDLTGNNITKGVKIQQTFKAWLPNAQFQYSVNRTKNIRFNYRTRTQTPTATQLQPIVDNTNPLNVREGNPNLLPEYSHNLSANYSSFDFVSFRNFFANISFSTTENRIANDLSLRAGGVQFQKYTNLNGVFNLNSNVNFGFPLKKLVSNVNLSGGIGFNKDASLINGQRNNTENFSLTQGLTVSYNKNGFDFNVSSSISYNKAKYSLQPQNDGDFFSHTVGAEITYTFLKSWIINSDFDYTYFTGRSAGFNQNLPLWTLSLSKQILKDKRGELKLTVFDVLDKNISVNRSVSDTYVEDQQFNVLKRYFMLTFTYNLKSFGQQPGMPNMPPGMRMPMIRM